MKLYYIMLYDTIMVYRITSYNITVYTCSTVESATGTIDPVLHKGARGSREKGRRKAQRCGHGHAGV